MTNNSRIPDACAGMAALALGAAIVTPLALADEPVPSKVITAPAPMPVLLDAPASERGGDLLLQIDSLMEGGDVAAQFGFANGEIGAVRFEIDPGLFPIQIKRVQIFWTSALANGTQSLQDSILIFSGNFDDLIANLEGPVLIDGGLNEFNLETLNIVVNNPTPITVGLQFFEAPNGDALLPTLVTDVDGCQSGLNWVFVPGANQWFNLCGFGVSGDLVIRMLINPMGEPQVCLGDINGDGVVDTADLGLLISVFGEAPPFLPEADLNDDGVADTADLGLLIGNFGTVCP